MSVSGSAKEMPPREALTEAEKELAEAKEAAARAEARWSEDLASGLSSPHIAASEQAFTEATTKATVMSKRRERLLETVRARRQAAEAAWKARREELIKLRLRKSEQVVEQAVEAMRTQPPDAFWLRVLNEEMRMVMFLKLGINGLAGICPLT
jgi:hypothetical protein